MFILSFNDLTNITKMTKQTQFLSSWSLHISEFGKQRNKYITNKLSCKCQKSAAATERPRAVWGGGISADKSGSQRLLCGLRDEPGNLGWPKD